MAEGLIWEVAAAFRTQLAQGDADAATALLRAWVGIRARLEADQRALLAQIEDARARGLVVRPGWLYRQERYQALLRTARLEIGSFSRLAHAETVRRNGTMLWAARRHSARLLQGIVAESLPGVTATLLEPSAEVVEQAVAFSQPGGPLARLYGSIAPGAADAMSGTLVQGVAQGWGAERIGRELRKITDTPLRRCRLISRTESLRVYRETSRLTYEANSDLLEGWVWTAALDNRTCAACAIMSGTLHPVTEPLDGHPVCRCFPVPRTMSWSALGFPGRRDSRPEPVSGLQWLRGQSVAAQRAILGDAKYRAWRRGEISLESVVGRRTSQEWGSMRYERSLAAIKRGDHPNTRLVTVGRDSRRGVA